MSRIPPPTRDELDRQIEEAQATLDRLWDERDELVLDAAPAVAVGDIVVLDRDVTNRGHTFPMGTPVKVAVVATSRIQTRPALTVHLYLNLNAHESLRCFSSHEVYIGEQWRLGDLTELDRVSRRDLV